MDIIIVTNAVIKHSLLIAVLYETFEMGKILISAMKEEDLEIVCERLVLLKDPGLKELRRSVLQEKLLQQLSSSESNSVFNELLIEIKADDLQYVCSSQDLLKITSSMRKPVKDDLLKLLKAHVEFDFKRSVVNGSLVGLRVGFDRKPRNLDLVKNAFKEYGGIKGMWIEKRDWVVYVMVSGTLLY